MDDLIQLAKERDPDAFTELMQHQMQSMYKVARSILRSDEDAADAIQETILSCWENMDRLRENRYFKTWMTRILINKCNDLLKARQEFLSEEQMKRMSAPDVGYENVEWKEMLNSLDERYRLVIMLYYVEGFKTGEISQILEIPESTVRTRLARGREKVAAIYWTERGRRVL